jgi:hypothetical protein
VKLFQKMYQAIDKFLKKESSKSDCGCCCSGDKTNSGTSKETKKCCKD